MNISQYLLFVSGIVLLAGCQQESPAPSTSKPEADPIGLELVHEWKIENVDLLPNPAFPKVMHDTTLVVLDRSLLSINHFTKSGELISTAGRNGRGPMEFLFMSAAAISRNGLVAITDTRNARLTIYNVYTGEAKYLDYDLGWYDQLQWVGEKLLITNSPFKIDPPGSLSMRYYDTSDEEIHSLYKLELELEPEDPSGEFSCIFCFIRFDEDLNFYGAPPDTSYILNKMNPYTDDVMTIRRSGVPEISFTDKQVAQMKAEQMDLFGISSTPKKERRKIFNYYTDHKKRIWVLLNAERGELQQFDIFDRDGSYVMSLQEPDSASFLHDFTGEWLTFSVRNENPDIFKVKLYKIVENR